MIKKTLFLLACALTLSACNKSTPAPQTANDQPNQPAVENQEEPNSQLNTDITKTEPEQTNIIEEPNEIEQQKDNSPAPEPQNTLSSDFVIGDEDVTIPEFAINVKLDDETEKKYKEIGETVIVAAYFDIHTSEESPESYKPFINDDSSGDISLTSKQIELSEDNRRAEFRQIKYPKKIYDILTEHDRDVNLLINIYSGRKTQTNNILDCDILEKKASEFAGKEFTLNCKLL